MSPSTWTDVLAALESRIELQRGAIEAGRPEDVPAFETPSIPEPLPAAARSRAEQLLQRTVELEAELSALLAATSRELELVRRFAQVSPDAADTAGSTYVDSSL